MRKLIGYTILLVASLSIGSKVASANEFERLSALISTVKTSCQRFELEDWLEAGLDPNQHAGEESLLQAAIFCKIPEKSGMSDRDRCLEGNIAREELVKLLLQAGADPNQRSQSGYTPLMDALLEPCNIGAIHQLLVGRADTRAVEPEYGQTAMSIALEEDTDASYLEEMLGDVDKNITLHDGLPPLLELSLRNKACGKDDSNVAKFKSLLFSDARSDIVVPNNYRSFSNISYAGLSLAEVLARRIALRDVYYRDGADVACLSEMQNALKSLVDRRKQFP